MIWCTHSELSDVVDGQRICLKCSSPIPEFNLERDLKRAFELVRRDHGMFGRHSMRCIETPEGEWCCADDCTLGCSRS